MAVLKVLHYPDSRLRTVAKPVEVVDDAIRTLAQDMIETMYAEDGIGLAATQVDRHIQLIVMDLSEDRSAPKVFINPKILSRDGTQRFKEACLSVPGATEEVNRAQHVAAEFLDEQGVSHQVELEGLMSVCLQHEMDHLDGKLFIDRLSPIKRARIDKKMKQERKRGTSG